MTDLLHDQYALIFFLLFTLILFLDNEMSADDVLCLNQQNPYVFGDDFSFVYYDLCLDLMK
jgi:hypothetical protein